MTLVNADYIRAINRASACCTVRCYAFLNSPLEDLHAQVKDALFKMLSDTDSDLIAGSTS